MTPAERFLAHRLREELAWMRAELSPDATELCALAALRDQCGLRPPLACRYQHAEYCVLDCPFRPEGLDDA